MAPAHARRHERWRPCGGRARHRRGDARLGSKNEDKERNIRKWFVDHDFIDGVILLPDNLFYNTSAAGVIVVLNKRKPAARKDKIVLLNASKRFTKGRPKNYLAEADVTDLARIYQSGRRSTASSRSGQPAREADYNLSPARWVAQANDADHRTVKEIVADLLALDERAREIDTALAQMLVKL